MPTLQNLGQIPSPYPLPLERKKLAAGRDARQSNTTIDFIKLVYKYLYNRENY
jgi:hypothetical protein